jgi:hypothetical protein
VIWAPLFRLAVCRSDLKEGLFGKFSGYFPLCGQWFNAHDLSSASEKNGAEICNFHGLSFISSFGDGAHFERRAAIYKLS